MRHGASQPYAAVRRTCEQTPEHLALGPSFALYAVLDSIVDNYLPIVQAYRQELLKLEHAVFTELSNCDVT